MSNFYNRPNRKGGFVHLESWFNDALDLLGVLSLKVRRTLADTRDIVKCVSLRETLDQFSNGSDSFVRVQRLKENYDNAGFSQTLEDIKTACGTEILAETCLISLNGREFLTAAEALYSLLVSIMQVRTTLDYAVKDYEETRRAFLEEGEPEDWDQEWYGSVLFQVGELSTCGLNDEALNQIRKLFDRQKYGYKNWLSSDAVVQQRGVYKDPRQRFHEQGRELRQRSREFGRITRSKSDQTPDQPQPDTVTTGDEKQRQPQGKTKNQKPAKKSGRPPKDQQQKWLGEALLILADNPDWTNVKIAKAVGVTPSTLGRNQVWKNARKANAGDGPTKGHVSNDRNGSPYVDGEYYDHNED
ncbi:hypothetical protein [Gimesia chilikensis]|uniref:Uncharacterized protein n=1 Tax=Gimesia chilikensis TaxID=2605989 RepID=A0A517PIK4_9PLAN|nr:hypothetical protein [Gimesia chilikensis]QDT19206.1 hypothetical protein HG66A1_09700 [Gimesia chilikensis]